MKGKIKGLFSVSEKESDYFDEKTGFIEIESCPFGGMTCTEHLALINKKMRKSRTYWLNKNYSQAIEELKIAFHKTTELDQPDCQPCAELFRATITKSIEVIHDDLRGMSAGFFKTNRYNSSFELASNVLKEIKVKI